MTQTAPPSIAPASQGLPATAPISWADPDRQAAFAAWLAQAAAQHQLQPDSLSLASADASFRRYFRIEYPGGTRIIMDAPPEKENCAPFVQVAGLMSQSGLNVPQVLAWDQPRGFMLLSDLGPNTMMSALSADEPAQAAPLFALATDTLVQWQRSSEPDVLPQYDSALLHRELNLFPDWYLAQHRQLQLDDTQKDLLSKAFEAIVQHNLAAPRVFVHRDFMARNLMLPAKGHLQPLGAHPQPAALGVLDFQDAVYGPITYDIASLMRDAFISWEEDFILDVTVRYWEKARKAGLMDFEDWHSDFGAFYRAVEWMGLQRHLKVAGIFARLTLRDGKPRYLADTPRFIQYIRATASRYRQLGPLLRLIDQVENIQSVTGFAYGRV
jgi:aminoglycoside/choline kinase family phosphotransferase